MKISKAITATQLESESNILLSLVRILSNKEVEEVEFKGNTNSTKVFVTGHQELDVIKGTEFDVIFSYNNPKNYLNIRSKILNFSFRKNQYVDVLPEGTGGGVLIDFFNENVEILNKLPKFQSRPIKGTNETLYLTTQPVMNRIIELLE